MKKNLELCEACKQNPVHKIEESDEANQPYKLCSPCHERLISLSLHPNEWYNLAVVHSPYKYYLHDDFYEENGVATQPELNMDEHNLTPTPTLENVRSNLKNLLDYTMTRWFLQEEEIGALTMYDKSEVLDAVMNRFSNTINGVIKTRLLEIVICVLGESASDWVRKLWGKFDEDLIAPLSHAAAYCLPSEEAFPLVIEKLKSVLERDLPTTSFICLHSFQSSATLDWIEENAVSFHSDWGQLAAVSQLTWTRIKSWLTKGQPLSLIALDAMISCIPSNEDTLHEMNPKILLTDPSEIKSILMNYKEIDNVPTVKTSVETILENKTKIFQYMNPLQISIKKKPQNFLIMDGTVQIHENRLDEYVDFINTNNFTDVYINDLRYSLDHINFLERCPQIESLHISSTTITDYSALYKLKNLKSLALEEPQVPLNVTALESYTNLEELYIQWNKNITGFESCPNLKELYIWKYKPKQKNLEELMSLQKLEKLRITQGNINSLKGCRAFPKLKHLEIYYLRNLEHIDEIENNASTLTYIEFDHCSKIKNHGYLRYLTELETVILSGCGNIQNLQFVKELPKLKLLSFVDSTIVDGNLEPCVGIDFVGFNNKRHYSHKFNELNKDHKSTLV
ncbi:hypothetical protein [Bacillus cereus]|uniref:Internalin n=1 Tax=Bacillus cereus TaxID=1396 RepID=A0A9X6Z9U7_BACCE|nr:hypothetical protein [Bacillus cereus]PFB27737.1 hypothetical protein CN388_15425 [Bacillus cereus]PFC14769.1 hypothetical protein CN284_05460 [Bacillus cereus]PFD20355.1 hypothetical protein CN263_19000 [Bacillus cereus]